MNENENQVIVQSVNQLKQCVTPCKGITNYQFQTPYTPNIQRALFTNRKNISASKFYIDEQLADQEIQQCEVDKAIQMIEESCKKFNLTFQDFSIVSQDVIRLLYVFNEIKMICTYPIEKLYQFLQVTQMRYPNSISLVLSTQKLQQIKHINDVSELKSINNGLVNICYSQLYRRDSDTVLSMLKTHNIKQTFYLDDIEQCRYLLGDNILQHIVCNRSVLPATNIQDLKNYLSIRTQYIGPTLDIGHTQSEYRPNYQLNNVIFMESESYSRMIMRLEEQNLERVVLKFNNKKNIGLFEDYCINNSINCSYDLVSSSTQLKSQYQVLVHMDQVTSLQEYLNDCAFLNKDCVSIVYLSKEQYLLKRRSLFFQQTCTQLLNSIITFLSHHQLKVKLNEIRQNFMIDNPMKLMNILEKHSILQIENILPSKCSVSIDTMADTNSESINTLLRYIKLNSRRILSLRKDISTIKHFEIDLIDLGKYMSKPVLDLCIWIESLSNIFLEPDFFDFMYTYSLNSDFNDQVLQICANDITNIKKQQIDELDIWFCLGNMLKTQSLSKCKNYFSNQDRFAEIVDKYFTAEVKLSVGDLFQHNHEKYLPIRTIEGLREKTKITMDIRKIYQQLTQSNIPINRRVCFELMKTYIDYNQQQLLDLVNHYLEDLHKSTEKYRMKGWMMDKPHKKVRIQ